MPCPCSAEDGELHIQLGKMRKGEVWKSALKGHAALNPMAAVSLLRWMRSHSDRFLERDEVLGLLYKHRMRPPSCWTFMASCFALGGSTEEANAGTLWRRGKLQRTTLFLSHGLPSIPGSRFPFCYTFCMLALLSAASWFRLLKCYFFG